MVGREPGGRWTRGEDVGRDVEGSRDRESEAALRC